METIRPTLVFTSGDGHWFQLVVKLVTLSTIDHVAIGCGDGLLLHARDRGVVLEPREAWIGPEHGHRWIAEFEILPDVWGGLRECLGHVGRPYDIFGIVRIGVGLGLARSLSLLGSWPVADRSHTCASFVMLLDSRGERVDWQGCDRRNVTPVELFDVAKRSPSFRRISQPMRVL